MPGSSVYLQGLATGKAVLWCYLIWYLTMVGYYFDADLILWVNALGLSLVIGTALVLSVSGGGKKRDYWQIFRLYFTPFAVSSFSSLIKGKGFIIIFSPEKTQNLIAVGSCLLFILVVFCVKKLGRAEELG